MSAFYISAAHKSSGKTTLSIGLCAAMRARGLSIQAFKKGPDYIDPIWLSQATGSACYNLDFFTSSKDYIVNQFLTHQRDKDVTLIEGNMGLYDGLSLDGSDSNAAMAKLLELPVIMVVDSTGTSRGIAPLLNGYQQFDSELKFAGVILNKVAGSRHETKLREVIEAYTDFEILGAVPRDQEIQLTERHLGLIPSNEMADQSEQVIQHLADRVNQYVNLDRLLSLPDPELLNYPNPIAEPVTVSDKPKIRIAIPMDEAFGFYYPGDIERFEALNVELVPFNTLKDHSLPSDIDGLFIGGGFPETQVKELSGNTSMLNSVKQAIENNLPCYAECGGLMYLCSHLAEASQDYPLCDVIPATVSMNKRPQGRGYVKLEATDTHPWQQEDVERGVKRTQQAHEFHYSSIEGLPKDTVYAYTVKRGTGIDGINDGIVMNNLLASYTHLRQTDDCRWVDQFVAFVTRIKSQN